MIEFFMFSAVFWTLAFAAYGVVGRLKRQAAPVTVAEAATPTYEYVQGRWEYTE